MITAVVHTYNAEKHLKRVLEALQGFDEVLVIDNESTDSTRAIAESFANISKYHPFLAGMLHHSDSDTFVIKDLQPRKDFDELLMRQF